MWYHCHVNVQRQRACRDARLWGPLTVDPKDPPPVEKEVTKDYIMMFSSWVSNWANTGPGRHPRRRAGSSPKSRCRSGRSRLDAVEGTCRFASARHLQRRHRRPPHGQAFIQQAACAALRVIRVKMAKEVFRVRNSLMPVLDCSPTSSRPTPPTRSALTLTSGCRP